MAYTTAGSIAEAEEYEFISVGTRGSVGSLVSMELDSLSRIKENLQQRKSANGRIRTETVSVFCDKRMALNSSVFRKDSSSVYVQSPRTPRTSDMSCEGRRSVKQGLLSGEVESPSDSCRRKREGLHRCRSQGRHRYLGEKVVPARKSVSDLEEEAGGFVWIAAPSRSVKKNRHQDLYDQTPLISIRDFDGKEKGDDEYVDIEKGRRLKSGLSIVEVVDLKCRGIANHNNNNKVTEKNRGRMTAIANRVMKGLSFSRLKPDDPHDSLV